MSEKFSNRLMVMLLAVLIAGFITTSPLVASETIVLKQSFFAPATHPYMNFPKEFARRVAAATKGRVKIEVYPGQSLSPAKEEIAAAHHGSIDMTYSVASYVTGLVPLLNFSVLPWSATQTIEDTTLASMKVTPIIGNSMRNFNLHLLFSYIIPGDLYCVVARKEIRSPTDLKGLKVRTPGGLSDRMAMNWGAAVVSVPASDLYTVLQRGLADGTIISKPSVKGLRLYEVASHVTDLKMGMNGIVVAINKDKWNRISKTDQQIITEIVPGYLTWLSGQYFGFIKKASAQWAKLEINVYNPNSFELVQWKKGAKKMWDNYAKSSPEAGKIVDILLQHGAGVK